MTQELQEQFNLLRQSVSDEIDEIAEVMNELEDSLGDMLGNQSESIHAIRAMARRYENKLRKLDERIAAIERAIGIE